MKKKTRHAHADRMAHIRLKPEVYEELQRRAQADRRTLTAFVSILLEDWLAKQKESERSSND